MVWEYRDFPVLLDPGANINLITRDLAEKLGIKILPTRHKLSTSTSLDSGGQILGQTDLIPMIYGNLSEGGFCVYQRFLVVESNMSSIYSLLCSNLNCQQHRGIIDTSSSIPTYSLRAKEASMPSHLIGHISLNYGSNHRRCNNTSLLPSALDPWSS
jgi:hypothetical protein